MWKRLLTVTRNRGRLEDLEAIGSVKGGDLSVGELGQELGLFVVLEVDVARREIELQAGESSHSANLTVAKSDRGRFVGAGCDETHALAVSLLGDRVEGADGCHFVRRGDGEVGGESKLCDLAFFSPSVITDHPTAHVTHLLEGRRGLQAALGGGRGRRGTPRLLSSDHLVFEIIICPRSPSAPSPVRLSNACRMRVSIFIHLLPVSALTPNSEYLLSSSTGLSLQAFNLSGAPTSDSEETSCGCRADSRRRLNPLPVCPLQPPSHNTVVGYRRGRCIGGPPRGALSSLGRLNCSDIHAPRRLYAAIYSNCSQAGSAVLKR